MSSSYVLTETIRRVPSWTAPPQVDFPADDPFATRDLFGAVAEVKPGPQAFLVEAPQHSRTGAHFHPVDQFQVFFPSPDTWYQRHDVSSVLVHYADAYTTYGPFGSGDHGFEFFTLRAEATIATAFMPGSRDQMLRSRGRNMHVELGDRLAGERPAQGSVVHSLFEPQDDQVAAYLVLVAPGASATSPGFTPNGGSYSCVIDGSLVTDAGTCGPKALAWTAPGKAPATLVAGSEGCAVLIVQFRVPVAPT